jgi:hypothetical protein
MHNKPPLEKPGGGFFVCADLKYCLVGYRQPQPTRLILIHTTLFVS